MQARQYGAFTHRDRKSTQTHSEVSQAALSYILLHLT